MAIKFGDTLENQNTAYPIVDIVGENVAGIFIVNGFTDANLQAIPLNARRDGSIAIDKTTGNIYAYSNSSTVANGTNQWDDADGTSWSGISGDNTLGSDSSFTNGTLQDNSPAVGGFTTTTTITSAIDQLNETLGGLVPTAPLSWANQTQSFNFAFSTTLARLVGKNSAGATITHVTNNNSGTYIAGTAVNWYQGTNAINFSKTFSFTNNNQAQTQFRFHLNDEVVSLESATDTSQTLAAADNQYGGSMTINVTTGDFPNTGSSADGFYTAVSSVALAANLTTCTGVTALKFDDASGNNPVTQTFYRADNEASASVVTTSNATQLSLNSTGTIGYTSGLPCYTNPTWDLKITTNNIIHPDALVYGAVTNSTTNNCVTFSGGSVVAAPSALTFNDLPNSTNNNVQQGDDFSNHTISGISSNSDMFRAINMLTTGSPTITANSIHGSGSATVGTNNSAGAADEIYYFYDQPSSNSSSNAYVFEDNLVNTLHTANTAGVRVTDPDTSGNGTDTPSDAVGSYGTWSKQYANGSAFLSLKSQDAITEPHTVTTNTNALRCKHSTTNYNDSTRKFAGTTTALDLSGRNSANAQYVTYAFPCNQSIASFTLKFKGDLDGGGNVWFKMFDSAATNSIETTNSSTGGWVPATVAYSGSGVAGASSSGCASGGNLSTTSTAEQNITITAGTARWNNGSDGKVYVRVKLTSGDFIEKLALLEI